MHRVAAGALTIALAGLAAVAGCLREKVPYCDNGAYCPEPLACTERSDRYCGPAFEVEQCFRRDDEAPCMMTPASASQDGFCEQGVCTPCDPNNAACTYDGWVAMQTPTSANLNAIWVAGPRDVYAAGESGTVIHWDGRAWTTLPAPGAGEIKALTGAPNRLFASILGTIYAFDGTSWTALTPPSPNAILGMWTAPDGRAFASGLVGTTGRYVDDAWSFTASTAGLNVSLNAVWGRTSSDAFAVGAAGTILRWNGTTWTSQSSGTNISQAVAGNETVAYAVGRTQTGGPSVMRFDGTWSDVTTTLPAELPSLLTLTGVWTGSSQTLAVARGGTILRLDGSVWTVSRSNTTADLYAVAGGSTDAFVVGMNGTVMRYRLP